MTTMIEALQLYHDGRLYFEELEISLILRAADHPVEVKQVIEKLSAIEVEKINADLREMTVSGIWNSFQNGGKPLFELHDVQSMQSLLDDCDVSDGWQGQ